MRRTILIFAIFSLAIFSCKDEPTKLKTYNLDDPCDFVNAYIENYKAQIKLYDKNKDVEDWIEADQDQLKDLKKFIKKIHRKKEKILNEEWYIANNREFFEIDLDVHNTSEKQMKNSLLLNKSNVNKIYNYFQKFNQIELTRKKYNQNCL